MAVANVLKAAVVVGGVVIILFFIMTVTQNNSERNRFEQFVSTYNKSYANETERDIRFKTFQVSVHARVTRQDESINLLYSF